MATEFQHILTVNDTFSQRTCAKNGIEELSQVPWWTRAKQECIEAAYTPTVVLKDAGIREAHARSPRTLSISVGQRG